MLRAVLLEPVISKVEDSFDRFMTRLMPLYEYYWHGEMEPLYGRPFNPAMQTLFPLWFNGVVKVVLAEEIDRVVGFIIAQTFRPMNYEARVFHINDYYFANRSEVRNVLQAEVERMIPILGCSEIWAETRGAGKDLPFAADKRWHASTPYTTLRWIQ